MFDSFFGPLDITRHARLVQLAPLAAVRAWLTGDWGPGDEPALCTAIRRDAGVDLDDDEMVSVFTQVLTADDYRADKAEAVLTLLRGAAQFRVPAPKAPRR